MTAKEQPESDLRAKQLKEKIQKLRTDLCTEKAAQHTNFNEYLALTARIPKEPNNATLHRLINVYQNRKNRHERKITELQNEMNRTKHELFECLAGDTPSQQSTFVPLGKKAEPAPTPESKQHLEFREEVEKTQECLAEVQQQLLTDKKQLKDLHTELNSFMSKCKTTIHNLKEDIAALKSDRARESAMALSDIHDKISLLKDKQQEIESLAVHKNTAQNDHDDGVELMANSLEGIRTFMAGLRPILFGNENRAIISIAIFCVFLLYYYDVLTIKWLPTD